MSESTVSISNTVSQSPSISVSDKNKVQNNSDSQNDNTSSDIIDIGNFIAQMQAIIIKLRNTLREYNEKQQELGWHVLTASIENKLKAIEESRSAGVLAGALQIAGAGLAGIGSGVGAFNKIGEVASHIGQVSEKIIVGAGQIGAADLTSDADIARAHADLQSQNAQAYNGNIGKTLESAQEIMRRLLDDSKALMNSLGQILSAVKMA